MYLSISPYTFYLHIMHIYIINYLSILKSWSHFLMLLLPIEKKEEKEKGREEKGIEGTEQ